MNANGATAGLSIDIWNEPDLTAFWNRPQAQYLQMWGRTWHRLRTEVGLQGVKLSSSGLSHEHLLLHLVSRRNTPKPLR